MNEVHIRGAWSALELRQFLQNTVIPIRLAAHLPDGFPVVLSLWFLWEEDAIWAAVRPDSRIARHLSENPRCAFEIAGDHPPYRGVRGQAIGTLHPDRGAAILKKLIARYLGGTSSSLAQWLLSRQDSEVAIRLDPVRFYAWDFTSRMKDITPGQSSQEPEGAA